MFPAEEDANDLGLGTGSPEPDPRRGAINVGIKTLLKRAVMRAYCRGWISSMTVVKAFSLFDLKGH